MTRETFTDLVLDSEPTLYRVAMSMLRNEKDCEDAVQTAILTAFEKLGTLMLKQPSCTIPIFRQTAPKYQPKSAWRSRACLLRSGRLSCSIT